MFIPPIIIALLFLSKAEFGKEDSCENICKLVASQGLAESEDW